MNEGVSTSDARAAALIRNVRFESIGLWNRRRAFGNVGAIAKARGVLPELCLDRVEVERFDGAVDTDVRYAHGPLQLARELVFRGREGDQPDDTHPSFMTLCPTAALSRLAGKRHQVGAQFGGRNFDELSPVVGVGLAGIRTDAPVCECFAVLPGIADVAGGRCDFRGHRHTGFLMVRIGGIGDGYL